MHLLLGYDRGTYRTDARVIAYRTGSSPELSDPTVVGSDWAVLRLSPAVLTERPVSLAKHTPLVGMSVILAGFDQKKPFVLTADTKCRIDTILVQVLLSDCVTAHGDSGGPLLMLNRRGEAELVGIQVAISRRRDRTLAGVAISILDSQLLDAIHEAAGDSMARPKAE
jgi:hypothetical protein